MHIKYISIRNFRGFLELDLKPQGHVLLMGEPGSGRSDLLDGIARVLDTEASRRRVVNEVDFHKKDTSVPIVIEITLGELGEDLEQDFLDYLEIWDLEHNSFLEQADSSEIVQQGSHEFVLRLVYRAEWRPEEERAEEWVYYPKASNPETGSFVHARRADTEKLGFSRLQWSSGKLLDLGVRSHFRRIIEDSEGGDFGRALDQYAEEVAGSAANFNQSEQLRAALAQVMNPINDLVGTSDKDASEVIHFEPDGGSVSGLLRSLGITVDLGDEAGVLPAPRQGSRMTTLIRVAEAFALTARIKNILTIDDLGDGLDPAAATHVAALMRSSAGQVWISTRLPQVAEIFDPTEVVRLRRDETGARFAHQSRHPVTKSDALASKNWNKNLLPAFSYKSVAVVEGPHDLESLHGLSLRLFASEGIPLPATFGMTIVNAQTSGSGGRSAVGRLGSFAKQMGLRVVVVFDGDVPATDPDIVEATSSCDAVVRLPDGVAIERALTRGLPEDTLRQAIKDIAPLSGQQLPPDIDSLTSGALEARAITMLKMRGGLHGTFIDALPDGQIPPIARQLLQRVVSAARRTESGFLQL